MITAERVFDLVLRAYPREFRAEYGREMAMLFRDQRREGRGGVRFWLDCGWDVIRSAPLLRMQSWRSQRGMNTHSTNGVMMRLTMAILSILIGAIEIVNVLVEGRAASAVGLDTTTLVVVSLGAVAGLLLVASGIVLASRSSKAQTLPLWSAITCAVVFLLIPHMSIFSKMLGIGFPIVLLLFLRFGRGQSVGAIA